MKSACDELKTDKKELDDIIEKWVKGKNGLREDLNCGPDLTAKQRAKWDLYELIVKQICTLKKDSRKLGKDKKALKEKVKECEERENRRK